METITVLKKAIIESRKNIAIIESNIENFSDQICALLIQSIYDKKLTHMEAMAAYYKLLDTINSKTISDRNNFRETPYCRFFERIKSALLECGYGFGVHDIDFYLDDFGLTKSYDATLDALYDDLTTEKEVNDLIEYIIKNNYGKMEIE